MEVSRQEFHIKRIKFIANMTVQAVCTTKDRGSQVYTKKSSTQSSVTTVLLFPLSLGCEVQRQMDKFSGNELQPFDFESGFHFFIFVIPAHLMMYHPLSIPPPPPARLPQPQHCGNASVFRTLSYKMRHDTTRASARVVSDAFLRQSPKDRSMNIVKMSTTMHSTLGEIKCQFCFPSTPKP